MVDIYEIRNLIDKLEEIEESMKHSDFQLNVCENEDFGLQLSKDEHKYNKLLNKLHRKTRKYLSQN